MRLLVYTLALYPRGRMLAKRWLQALRQVGKFSGDVVLLSDKDEIVDGHTRWLNIQQFLVRAIGSYVCAYKPLVQFEPGVFDDYDFLLYLDSDVLVSTGRFVPCLEEKARAGRIVVQEDITPIRHQKKWSGWELLTPEELERFGEDSINAGIVGVPTTRLGRTFLLDWHAVNAKAEFGRSDQKRLLLLLVRKYLAHWDYIGDSTFGRELVDYDKTFVHFTARRDELMEDFCKEVLAL